MLDWKDERNWKLREETSGYLYYDSFGIHEGINTSSAWSELVKEAGKCERFNSDILITWNIYSRNLESLAKGEVDSFDMYIGFRRNGTYETRDMETVMQDKYGYTNFYNIFWIHMEIDKEVDWQRTAKFKFYKYNM